MNSNSRNPNQMELLLHSLPYTYAGDISKLRPQYSLPSIISFASTKTGSLICCEVFPHFMKQSFPDSKPIVKDNRRFNDQIHNFFFAAYWSLGHYKHVV